MKRSKSALKRIRQNERHRVINRANLSKYKTEMKKLEELIEQKNIEAARNMLPAVTASIDEAVTKKVLSKNSASRKKSSLARRVNALA